MPIGNSLNNPGNIRVNSSVVYEGEVIPSSSEVFKQFQRMDLGFRAMASDLYHYIVHSGLDTITKIINTYAPAGDGANNPASYINFVSQQSGVDPNQTLTKDDFSSTLLGFEEPNMKKIIRAMATDEEGVKPSESDLTTGYNEFITDEDLPS